jgi:MFS family permease
MAGRLVSQPAARTAERPVKVAIDEILDARRGSWLQLTVIALMTAVTVLDGLDMQLLPLSAPLILSEWGICKLALSPAMGGALMGMAVGTVMGGYIGDRFGRRRTLVGAVGFFGLATLACALARAPLELTVLRIISGIGFGASFPSATAVVAEWIFALSSWSPVILTALGVSVRTALTGSTYYGLATMAGTLGAGLAGSRLGTRSVMMWLSAAAALVALAISTAAFVDLEQLRRTPAVLIASIAFMGGCIAGLQMLLWVLAANAYSTECRATGVAVAAGIGRVGAIISSVGAGALLSFLPDGYFFVCMVFAFGLVGLGMSAVDRHLSADTPCGENLPDQSGLAPTTAVTARKV